MSLKHLKEKISKIRDNYEKIACEEERFNSLVEEFREETKDLGDFSYFDVKGLCDSFLDGEFPHNQTSGKHQFQNKVVRLEHFEITFYLVPPGDTVNCHWVIYTIEMV